jgi:2-iminobutanoate/2-iminopropanoate deaminase
MAIRHFGSRSAPTPVGSYSQGVIANGFLFTCGMGPMDPLTGVVADGDISVQTRQVLRNLSALLGELGLNFSQVVKMTCHLQELHRDFALFDSVYREFFSPPYPVRTTVGSTFVNQLVGIEVVAAL